MQIQISWLLKKSTDLDLHCLQRQGISGFSRTRVNFIPMIHKNDSLSIEETKVLACRFVSLRCNCFIANRGGHIILDPVGIGVTLSCAGHQSAELI